MERTVRVNGTDMHYVDVGSGPLLLLLHGGGMSTNPIWARFPGAYVGHMERFAAHFRVIAPDARVHGRTAHPGGGPISMGLLADDVLGLIEALGLDRPLIAGFSMGGLTATMVALRQPGVVSALVNDAGYDAFNPEAPSFAFMRAMFGGHPGATRADPEAFVRFAAAHGMQAYLELMKADHDAGQGPGAWQNLLAATFEAMSTSPGYTFEDLRKIEVPTLILTGDRDVVCSVEEAVTAYRMLPKGELAIVPGEGHGLPDAAIDATIAFLRRAVALAGG